MPGDGSPYIKEEQDEFGSLNKYSMNMPQQYGQFTSAGGDFNGVDPSSLTMNGTGMNNFGSSFGMGQSVIPDDELESLDLFDNNGQFQGVNNNGFNGNINEQGNFFQSQSVGGQQNHMGQQVFNASNQHVGSPFNNDVVYQMQSQGFHSSLPIQNGFHRKMHSMERHPSDSRSPMTPKTPAINSLHIGTPDSHLSQQAYNQQLHAQAKAAASQWDGTPGSGQSWLESPLPSPHGGHMHPQITEIMAGKHASLPTKVEGAHSASMPTFQSQEAKKKRRRESHNLVERRRRDNINERIQDLSRLVPQHRLEDEKVRKHISANGPMSPAGISPPHATSLLAGGSGRRAASGTAGNITQGLPLEEKDKGPNKGDILNGAVGWMRDTMWYLYVQHQQLEQMKAEYASRGLEWPLEQTEEEHRMQTELIEAIERNGVDNFGYSRGPGSGLRVPKHTNYAGDSLDLTPKEEDELTMDMS